MALELRSPRVTELFLALAFARFDVFLVPRAWQHPGFGSDCVQIVRLDLLPPLVAFRKHV